MTIKDALKTLQTPLKSLLYSIRGALGHLLVHLIDFLRRLRRISAEDRFHGDFKFFEEPYPTLKTPCHPLEGALTLID